MKTTFHQIGFTLWIYYDYYGLWTLKQLFFGNLFHEVHVRVGLETAKIIYNRMESITEHQKHLKLSHKHKQCWNGKGVVVKWDSKINSRFLAFCFWGNASSSPASSVLLLPQAWLLPAWCSPHSWFPQSIPALRSCSLMFFAKIALWRNRAPPWSNLRVILDRSWCLLRWSWVVLGGS